MHTHFWNFFQFWGLQRGGAIEEIGGIFGILVFCCKKYESYEILSTIISISTIYEQSYILNLQKLTLLTNKKNPKIITIPNRIKKQLIKEHKPLYQKMKKLKRESRPSMFTPISQGQPLPTSHLLSIEISKYINNYKRQLNLYQNQASQSPMMSNKIGKNSLKQIILASKNMQESLFLAFQESFVEMFSNQIMKNVINAETIIANIVEGFKKVSQFISVEITKYHQLSQLQSYSSQPRNSQTKTHQKLFAPSPPSSALCPQCNHILQQKIIQSQLLHIQYSQFEDPYNLFTAGINKFQEETLSKSLYQHEGDGQSWSEAAIVENQKKVYAHISKIKDRVNRRIGEIVQFVNQAEKYVNISKEIQKKGAHQVRKTNVTPVTFDSCYKTIVQIIEKKLWNLLKKIKNDHVNGYKEVSVQAGDPLSQYSTLLALKDRLQIQIEQKDREIKKIRSILQNAQKALQKSIIQLQRTKYHLKQSSQQESKYKAQLEQQKIFHKQTSQKLQQKITQIQVMSTQITQMRMQLMSQQRNRDLRKSRTSKRKKITDVTIRGSLESDCDRISEEDGILTKQNEENTKKQKQTNQMFEMMISQRTADKRVKMIKNMDRDYEKRQQKYESPRTQHDLSRKASQKSIKQISRQASKKLIEIKQPSSRKNLKFSSKNIEQQEEKSKKKVHLEKDIKQSSELQRRTATNENLQEYKKQHLRNKFLQDDVKYLQQYTSRQKSKGIRFHVNQKCQSIGVQKGNSDHEIGKIDKELPIIRNGKQNKMNKLKKLTMTGRKQKVESQPYSLDNAQNDKCLQSQATTMTGFNSHHKIGKRKSIQPHNMTVYKIENGKTEKVMKDMLPSRHTHKHQGSNNLSTIEQMPRLSLLASINKSQIQDVLSLPNEQTQPFFNQQDVTNLYLCLESAYMHEKSLMVRQPGQQNHILNPKSIRFITHILTMLAHCHLGCTSLYWEIKMLLLNPFDSIIMQNTYIKVQISLNASKGKEKQLNQVRIKEALLKILALHRGCEKQKGKFGLCQHIQTFCSKLHKIMNRNSLQKKVCISQTENEKSLRLPAMINQSAIQRNGSNSKQKSKQKTGKVRINLRIEQHEQSMQKNVQA